MTVRPLLACLLLLAVGCATEDPEALTPGLDDDRYAGTGLVLESADHGPELCLGPVADSLPPQCRGVPLQGWTWSAVDGEQHRSGSTWGAFRVVGRFDGTSLTVSDAAPPPEPAAAAQDGIGTPCPEPEGGWVVQDGRRVGDDALDATVEAAQAAPDHAGVWVDQPLSTVEQSARPQERVLNAAFTGQLDRHEQELRRTWGGPLCLVQRPRTLAELTAVQDELFAEVAPELGLEPTAAGVDQLRGVVVLDVVAASRAQLAAVEQRYGAGVVDVRPALQPVP